MLAHQMYANADRYNTPSFFKLFKKYDRDGSGQLDFAEVPVGCSHAVSVRALLIVQYQLVARLSC